MKALTIARYVMTPVGLSLLAASWFFYSSTSTFLKEAARTEGTVVELDRTVVELDRTVPKGSRSDSPGRRTAVSYKPVVHFVTAKGEKIELYAIMSSDPPKYHKGQKVEVVYLPAEPHNAKIHDFLSLWGVAVLLGSAGGVVFLIGGGIMLVSSSKTRSEQYLRKQGISIKTEFQRVIMDASLTVNGKHPYRILTQWQHPSTSETYIFKSKNIWHDPTSHIKNRQITVFIERNNPRKYFVDLSFLPIISD